jgi:hypothetical protein
VLALGLILFSVVIAKAPVSSMHPVGICGYSLLSFHTIALALFFQGTRALKLGGSSKPIRKHSKRNDEAIKASRRMSKPNDATVGVADGAIQSIVT